MFAEYLKTALRTAQYEYIEEDKAYFGRIPLCQGVWTSAPNLEACRDELEDVLEGWLILSLQKNLPIPEINGISFKPKTLVNA